ncbi:membrane protein [Candidatus Mancarchaeum acidiphilum]|uniref:Membrane protein n=1 Tax=Candidatus Mancarchaeum acidiphilum TaxID=1920749 RepID=A0A218NMR8_9ARCH|nr:hypothetical protein [Candidatus Mancarchaeum acidiphilum]ASI13765.1 membrane protein [Candidatus Mancarchaeum acidiphilum]
MGKYVNKDNLINLEIIIMPILIIFIAVAVWIKLFNNSIISILISLVAILLGFYSFIISIKNDKINLESYYFYSPCKNFDIEGATTPYLMVFSIKNYSKKENVTNCQIIIDKIEFFGDKIQKFTKNLRESPDYNYTNPRCSILGNGISFDSVSSDILQDNGILRFDAFVIAKVRTIKENNIFYPVKNLSYQITNYFKFDNDYNNDPNKVTKIYYKIISNNFKQIDFDIYISLKEINDMEKGIKENNGKMPTLKGNINNKSVEFKFSKSALQMN